MVYETILLYLGGILIGVGFGVGFMKGRYKKVLEKRTKTIITIPNSDKEGLKDITEHLNKSDCLVTNKEVQIKTYEVSDYGTRKKE
jgi:hypothetical protein